MLFLVALARPAAAHVVVLPEESEAGGWERYSLIVPNEKKSPTVRIDLKLPVGIDVMGIESKPGWEATHEPFPIGAARVRWSGGRIPAGQMLTFDFLVWNPPAARTLKWDATQWYEDGSSDHWGADDGDHPASETVLREAGSGHGHRHEHSDAGAEAAGSARPGTHETHDEAPTAVPTAPPTRDATRPAASAPVSPEHVDTTHAEPAERGESRFATLIALAALGISVAALAVARSGRRRDRLR